MWVNFKGDSSGESKEPLWIKVQIRTILKDREVSVEAFTKAEGAAASGLVSEHIKDSLLSVVRKRKISSCRQGEGIGKHLDPPEDREMPRRRGRQMTDPAMEREMRDLLARLKDMETDQRRTVSARYLSDSESEIEVEHEEEVASEDAANEHLIRAISRMGARVKMDIAIYEGNLDAEELLDWIRALDTYFDYEYVEEDKKVKHDITILK
jgi:hypothetical protein